MLNRVLLMLCLVMAVVVVAVSAKALPGQELEVQPHQMLDPYGNHLVDDDGSLDAALLNYLFAKQFFDRLRSTGDVKDLQAKRSYWKQCAFNAVSCFGKRK